ncbi:CidA/LrgA family protein [Neobacillus sp. PS3-34]|uniref:CidA/LrgA family protein n=1 Tax=Neobacillus sp. PS3-34 TaxID=3070678 RepID=UPI0027E17364|nr:CidA/LrgA family protein [Neobacillus sp. PS3-34]WML47936.1 CidA/LrgA family protein [Neobacillus sp. PS3-34]
MKRAFAICLQLGILYAVYESGNILVHFLHLIIPGNVAGMMILFLLLSFKIIKIKWIEAVSSWLLKHLAFFFVPIAAGLMNMAGLFVHKGLPILLILSVSAFAGIITAGKTAQVFITKKEEDTAN